MADPYHGLAADYDWIFDDGALAGGAAINLPATARLLQRIGPASEVLDAACGTGVDAAVLARRGLRVRAADGSEAMVEAAAARFRREGLAIPVQRCLWADLPAAIGERFDVVLCTGNALVHAAGRDAMVEALTGLRRMARPGGHVVVDSRDWEKLHAERRIVHVMDQVRTRCGRRCVVLYAWEISGRLVWRLTRKSVTDLLDFCDHYLQRKQAGRVDPVPVPRARPAVNRAVLDQRLGQLAGAPVRPEFCGRRATPAAVR
jgi:SAM-dependent methyltransferase